MYSIIWSPTAQISYFKILEYLDENWTHKELEANPLLYPYSKESDTHKCVVVKQVSLFYRVRNNDIELLVFWDTRQDPAKIVL